MYIVDKQTCLPLGLKYIFGSTRNKLHQCRSSRSNIRPSFICKRSDKNTQATSKLILNYVKKEKQKQKSMFILNLKDPAVIFFSDTLMITDCAAISSI